MQNRSLFSRLYARRPSDFRSQQENFLSEIFAFVLEHDREVLAAFFDLIKAPHLEAKGSLRVQTQKKELESGQPDIEIVGQNFWVLIEAKVESTAGEFQLDQYANILKAKTSFPDNNRLLVYLTKYPEWKGKPQNYEGPFAEIQWHQIYHILKPGHSDLAKQLKQYLKELHMDTIYTFTPQDLSALIHFHELVRKIDFYLCAARKLYAQKITPNISKDSARYTRLKFDSGYYNVARYHYGHTDIGIVWWHEEPEAYLQAGTLLNEDQLEAFGEKNLAQFRQFFENIGWTKFGEHPQFEGFECRYPVSMLLSQKDQKTFIENWYKARIEEWEQFKEEMPQYFSGPVAVEEEDNIAEENVANS